MYFITAPRITAKNMGLTINLLGQPSGKAERTIKIFSAGKGNNKKRNRQIFLTVSAFFYAPTHDVAPRAVSIADAIDAIS